MLIDEYVARARQFLRGGQALEAARLLVSVAEQVHLTESEYDQALRLLAEALAVGNLGRAAATVWLYLRNGDEILRTSKHPVDIARGLQLRRELDHRQVVAQYRQARWPAHAAIACERGNDFATARVLWEEVSNDPRLREDPYIAALVSFNMGRALNRLGDDGAAQRCRVRATRLLEEAADVLEARGLRDRAFDCFQVLLTLGIETGSFENLAEGYLNCIRILKEDHLKYYAMQYYEDFIGKAEAASEHHAVATILHEAADYARSLGMTFHHALRIREAQGWQRAADHLLRNGSAAELAENSLLAAIGAYTSAGLHGKAVALFQNLAGLPLEEKKQLRFAALAQRYAGARDEVEKLQQLPDYIRQPVQYPDIWNVDTIEWEEAGDPVETCGEILSDLTLPPYIRRKALLARLFALMSVGSDPVAALAGIAERLGAVQVYAVLAPLESLYNNGKSAVRAAVLKAAETLYFKRTFVLITKGVTDGDVQVRRAAQKAIGQLHFPHAFDPLSRLHRDSVDPDVRRAALASIGRIQTIEAVEYLINALAQGSVEERQMARDLLARSDFVDTGKAILNAIESETGEVQRTLRQLRSQRNDR